MFSFTVRRIMMVFSGKYHSSSLNTEILTFLCCHPLFKSRCLQRIQSINSIHCRIFLFPPTHRLKTFYIQLHESEMCTEAETGLPSMGTSPGTGRLLWCQSRHQQSITLCGSQLIPDKAPKPSPSSPGSHRPSGRAAIWDETYL